MAVLVGAQRNQTSIHSLIIILGDHALVDLGCIGHFNPKLITVRSKSRDLLSIDSSAVPIQSSKMKKSIRVSNNRFHMV